MEWMCQMQRMLRWKSGFRSFKSIRTMNFLLLIFSILFKARRRRKPNKPKDGLKLQAPMQHRHMWQKLRKENHLMMKQNAVFRKTNMLK
uniref:Uncharacterized protein n=1 Tax=Picea sitchensis TaxID=3332 RepID=A9P1G9_PICSI|nr:unknown [Picea sitchensis]